MSFGEQILSGRSQLDLTQAQVAAILGVSIRTVWAWEESEVVPSELVQEAAISRLQRLEKNGKPGRTYSVASYGVVIV